MKLLHLLILIVVACILFCAMYCIIPLIVMIFGGSFLTVAQNEIHVFFGIIIYLICIGYILDITVDKDFYFKD